MFTGIVSAVGTVARATRAAGNGKRDAGLTLVIRAPFKGLRRGESVAVNGACLTVERVTRGGFTVHVVETTEGRTLLGEYVAGRRVNLERALRAADRLGGHIVQGHVDGVGVVERVQRRGDAWVYDLRVPRAVREVCIREPPARLELVALHIDAAESGDYLLDVPLVRVFVGECRGGELHQEAVNLDVDCLVRLRREMFDAVEPEASVDGRCGLRADC